MTIYNILSKLLVFNWLKHDINIQINNTQYYYRHADDDNDVGKAMFSMQCAVFIFYALPIHRLGRERERERTRDG